MRLIFLGDVVFPVPAVCFGGTVVLTSSGLNEGDVIKVLVLIDDK